MHEMEETADHVLVIGRGRLIADTSIAEFTLRAAGNHVHVASPDAAALAALLERAGGHVTAGDDGALTVAGLLGAADRRPRRRARAARARADAAPREPRGGVHGADRGQRRLPPGGARMTPFSATLRSEWTKLSSLRSTKVMLAFSLVLALALSALLAIVVGNTWDDWKPADRRDYEPIGAALVGQLASAILFLVIGVKAATAEYGAGMMRLTLTATPRRGRVLAAKALVVAAVTLVAALVGNVAMFLLARAILSSYGIETTSLARRRRAARRARLGRAGAAVPAHRRSRSGSRCAAPRRRSSPCWP